MFGRGLFSWFSPKQDEPAFHTWDAQTASIQNQQPSSPSAPSLEDVRNEQTTAQNDKMKLRGGGMGDICCGLCAGLLCFECCLECC